MKVTVKSVAVDRFEMDHTDLERKLVALEMRERIETIETIALL